jgi:tetratricopeptide (TPR) repeat protein
MKAIDSRFHRLRRGSVRSRGFTRSVAILLGIWFLALALPGPLRASSQYDQAALYIQEGKPRSAITLLQRMLKQSPRDVRAQNLMGLALTSSGKLAEANVYFKRALRLDPKFYPALKNLAVNELKQQQVDEATAHFQQALAIAPQDPVAHLALAEIYFQKREFGPAVEHYIGSDGLFLRSPQTILNFARSCFESDQAGKAAGALELLGANADGRAHFQAGVMLAQLEKYEAAAKQFDLARRDYPDPYEVGYNLTLAYLRALNYPAAIETAEDLISKGYNKKAELYNLLADAYERSSRTVDAYNALRTATELAPLDENNYLDLVLLGVDHRNYDLAYSIIEIGLKNIPDSYRLRLQRGAVLAFQGKLTEALEDFQETAKQDPGKDLPYYGMVMALMQTDQTDKAREIVRQRLATHPDYYLLLYAKGEMEDRVGAPPGSPQEIDAVKALERSVQLEPNMAASRVALGRMLLRRGEIDHAIVELEKAVEIDPTDLSPCYQLSMAYRRKGNKAKAEELQAKFEKYKAEDRDRYMNVQILRLLRKGEK